MDELFNQMANISKAHGYDILSEQVKELKDIINQLIDVGELEDITFTNKKDTDEFQELVKKAKIKALIF